MDHVTATALIAFARTASVCENLLGLEFEVPPEAAAELGAAINSICAKYKLRMGQTLMFIAAVVSDTITAIEGGSNLAPTSLVSGMVN